MYVYDDLNFMDDIMLHKSIYKSERILGRKFVL